MQSIKLFIFICFISAASVFFILKFESIGDNYHYYSNKNCFVAPTEDIRFLEDIDEAEVKPTKSQSNKQIFFLETSCSNSHGGAIHLTSRQICGIESVARLHPNHKIFVLFLAPVGFQLKRTETDTIQILLKYDNVYLRNINLTKYSKDTPLEDFFAQYIYGTSRFFNTHLSDILRFLTLYKYGGLYLDTDIICLKSFEPLEKNFVAAESYNSIGSSVIHFGNDELGRFIAEQCLIELSNTFDGKKWAYNGPGVLTRVISRLCETNKTALMTNDVCSGFKILPIETFAPILWKWNNFYFDEDHTNDVIRLTKDAYIIHLFNHMNKNIPVVKKSNVAYALFAKDHCPDMFKTKSKVF